MFVVHKTFLNKKSEKIMHCPTIKSFCFLFGIGFFFKYINYFAFIAENFEKNTFFNEISTKFFKLLNSPRFN
jgi:hypothetical protein